MTLPDPSLLWRYNTHGVLRDKLAGKLPLAAAIALPLLGYAVMRSSARGMEDRRDAAAAGDARERAIQALRSSGANQSMRGSGIPTYLPTPELPTAGGFGYYGDDFGDGGKYAEQVGRALAKQAGIGANVIQGIANAGKKLVGATPGIGRGSLKSQALTGALALGGAYAGVQGGKAVLGKLDTPAKTMVQGFGPKLPEYVNSYGQPVH